MISMSRQFAICLAAQIGKKKKKDNERNAIKVYKLVLNTLRLFRKLIFFFPLNAVYNKYSPCKEIFLLFSCGNWKLSNLNEENLLA